MKNVIRCLALLLCLFSIASLEAKKHKTKQSELKEHHLSIGMVFNNEAPYLKEWIEYHLLLGVDHFYLYNNLSTDDYQAVLQPYIDKKIVDLIDWTTKSNNLTEWDRNQIAIYNDCLKRARGQTKWLAIIDSDEFLLPVKTDNLSTFLEPYEKMRGVGGILVNWVMYGTSNVEKIPEDRLLIETLVYSSMEGNSHFKTICMVDCVSHIVSPHYAIYKYGWGHCTPKGKMGVGVEIDQIRINHYWARDIWYLENIKIPRRKLWDTDAATCRIWAQASNRTYDTAIFRFIEPLRKRMQQFP